MQIYTTIVAALCVLPYLASAQYVVSCANAPKATKHCYGTEKCTITGRYTSAYKSPHCNPCTCVRAPGHKRAVEAINEVFQQAVVKREAFAEPEEDFGFFEDY